MSKLRVSFHFAHTWATEGTYIIICLIPIPLFSVYKIKLVFCGFFLDKSCNIRLCASDSSFILPPFQIVVRFNFSKFTDVCMHLDRHYLEKSKRRNGWSIKSLLSTHDVLFCHVLSKTSLGFKPLLKKGKECK